MSAVENVLGKLDGVRRNRDGGTAQCPAHPDRTPSLSVTHRTEGDPGAVVKCFAGCPTEAVVAAIGMTMADLFDARPASTTRRIVAEYAYRDEAGELLFQVVRFDPKGFSQRRPDGRGGWAWKLGDTRIVLYKLPELIAADPAQPVYVVEGEKDVEALTVAGHVATCGPQGAGKWSKVADLARDVLAGRDVIVVADKDDAGRNHARDVVASLVDVAASVAVVGAAIGKDAADHLGADRTVEEFVPVDLDDVAEVSATADEAPTGKAPPARDALVSLGLEAYDLGRTEDERTFLVAHDGPNLALFGGPAKQDLARRHRATTGKSVGRSPLDEAWMTIEGYAADVAKTELPLRMASTDAGELVIDLGDVAGRAIVIDANGWQVVDRSPVTFRRSKAMLPLPLPQRGGHVDELFTLLNVADINRDLFTAWLTSTMFDRLPHPAPVLRGEQGAAKSTTARACTRLLDPCMASTQKPPKAEDEWSHACSARWIVAVDNVSTVPEWWSDALCRTITGDGWLRRKLYEDDDVVVTKWRRCVILNGITLGASLRPDLAERLVLFELERPTAWLTESEVDARFDEMHARVLGALLDRASATLAAMGAVEPVRDLRMADFATFLAAYDHANGTRALPAYRTQVDEAFDEAIASDPLAQAVVDLMVGRQSWEGTTSELRTDLDPYRPMSDGEFWPKSAQHLSTTMTRSAASLRHLGIEWHRPAKGPHGRRIARLSRVACGEGGEGGKDSLLVVSGSQIEEAGQGEDQAQQWGNPRHPRHLAPPPDAQPPWTCPACGGPADVGSICLDSSCSGSLF